MTEDHPRSKNDLQALKDQLKARPRLGLKDFEVGPTLGTGTFGKVKQVRYKHSTSQLVFALKMLRKTDIVKLGQLEHIKSEKQILSSVCHPFIVSFIVSFQTSQHVCMLFEFLTGGELFRHLRHHGRFAEDVALFYSAEILLALRHLHLRNIVYRDLKPENLLVSSAGHVKLADFGFAKTIAQDRTYTLCGTPEYLSPELIRGQKVGYGKTVDWWALGVLVYEMLVGSSKKFSALLR